ncbi:MAG TPA: hypothetical protein VNO52_05560, partial [Methylomirabilota bacterium]|nr:hypothetical protein [Methylomirabilota bacterium]
SVDAAAGEAWAEWVVTATGVRSNSASDAVRAVVTRRPALPAFAVASRAADGRMGNDAVEGAEISGDGRWLVFTSSASDLVRRDYNLQEDVFLVDRETRWLECLSKRPDGTNAAGRTHRPSISRDGRYVTFQSGAADLVANDTNDREDVFLLDRQTRSLSRISAGPGPVQWGRESGWPKISADGRHVVFASLAGASVIADTNDTWDVFLRDVDSGAVQCLSQVAGRTANDESNDPEISADGGSVVFTSLASDLTANDTNDTFDIFLWRRGAASLRLVSRTADGRAGNGSSTGGSISADGRWVLFQSRATDLAVADPEGDSNLFLYDSDSDTLSRLEPPPLSPRQRGGFFGARLAPDGRHVTLLADVLTAAGGRDYFTGVFLYDRETGQLSELSRLRDGTPGWGHSVGASVSADARHILLATRAGNLLGESVPALDQLLVLDRARFQPDEWIRRGSDAPWRGQETFGVAGQRVELTIRFNFTNDFFITLRNHARYPDALVFKAPGNIPKGIKARYFVPPGSTDITASATNAGWTSPMLAPGATLEIRVQLVASNTNLFNQDLVFLTTSATDPTRSDRVWLRLLRDDDRDGLPNDWELQYFRHATNALAGADADGDGLTNGEEYVAGSNPTNRLSRFAIAGVRSDPASGVEIAWPSVTNRFYVLEGADGLDAPFQPLGQWPGAPGETRAGEPWRTNAGPRFYRVRVDLP